jgi:superfamily II DNA or RNA helicase
LRPLSGNEDQICGIFTGLQWETIEPADFPLPTTEVVADQEAGQLLLDAAKLSLRSGAGPFRCLGRLSVRPRPYQIVPLLMALRLETVRLLIADDVGIGKTIEAGLIARELLDRKEVKRLAVLCPPQLCDQWRRELKEKFLIDAVVVRSGTVSKLERGLPSADSHIFSYYPHIIVSLDYAKSERRKASFLVHCPDLVIVDEAHTCTNNSKANNNQQRYQLVKEIAEKNDRHLILLSATPHSGIETSFSSLLGLLKPLFGDFNLDNLSHKQRTELANHFVQRRRADVRRWLGSETPFPERESQEVAYQLSRDYRQLFDAVYELVADLVGGVDDSFTYAQKRGRYWAALAILRCVMSSPAAAATTLSGQADKGVNKGAELEESAEELNEELTANYVYDLTEKEQVVDVSPTVVVERATTTYTPKQRQLLRSFVADAEKLKDTKKDSKLRKAIALSKRLLAEGFNPIIWCRYIATANYVATALKNELQKGKNNETRVIAITGELLEDEREIRLAELAAAPRRVLVSTDCLSEGINLQQHFTAAVHYDLPWNPNKLEQREGRIDRYGQTAPVVKCILLCGENNLIDVAVLEVLIRKAVTIHKTLGITVPLPMDSGSVQETVFKSLFEKAADTQQLSLFELLPEFVSIEKEWERAVNKEKENRTRFAQRAIKPEEVEQELIESDEILGDEATVERFVRDACARLNASLVKRGKYWSMPSVPQCVLPLLGREERKLAFTFPTPEGVEYVGRNHPLVEGLARFLLEDSLNSSTEVVAGRCGVTVTNAVSKTTAVFLTRLRHLLETNKQEFLLAEECLTLAFTGTPSNPQWLPPDEAKRLLENAEPFGKDWDLKSKRDRLDLYLSRLGDLQVELERIAGDRSQVLSSSYSRVRAITKEGKVKVKPQLPMDILGVYVLQPN